MCGGGEVKATESHLHAHVHPYQEYIHVRGRKESVVLRIAMYKRALKSNKVKLCNITQNTPQTSGTITTRTHVLAIRELPSFQLAPITSRETCFARPLLYKSVASLYICMSKHPICSVYTIIACRRSIH